MRSLLGLAQVLYPFCQVCPTPLSTVEVLLGMGVPFAGSRAAFLSAPTRRSTSGFSRCDDPPPDGLTLLQCWFSPPPGLPTFLASAFFRLKPQPRSPPDFSAFRRGSHPCLGAFAVRPCFLSLRPSVRFSDSSPKPFYMLSNPHRFGAAYSCPAPI